jgi:naphthalene 1,2-dioxygenase ferredoxin component
MEKTWLKVIDVSAVPTDDVTAVTAAGREIAIYGVDGEVYATDNICTHGHARLCDGFLEGHEIECPMHQGKFDVRNGKAMCEPLTTDVQTYPIKVEDGEVFIEIAAG